MNAPPPTAAVAEPQLLKFESNNKYLNATQDFFKSNSIVAKLAFLLLVVFVFILALRIGISILGYFFGPSDTAQLVQGTIDAATNPMIIPQNPDATGAVTLNRSVNESGGIEFTWSVWMFVNGDDMDSQRYRCVFYKGNDYATQMSSKTDDGDNNVENMDYLGMNFPNNSPGLYIKPNTNDIVVIMNTFNVINEEITIQDIPLNKWMNVIIRCKNTNLDVYINGTIAKSHVLHGVPKQNYGDVYVAPNGGFSGNISNLWYYNYALGTTAIQALVNKGPNTTMTGESNIGLKDANYLSLRWFFYGAEDAYNP
jgi:hypothetical protein